MSLSTQPYKGTRDFYPDDMRIQNWMFNKMRHVALAFGFQEYTGPMLEAFDLYAAKTGEEIVNNQLYWLVDRGERKLAIRPEMTPTLARMVAGKFHELPKPIRWFSIPNLWRYERPQRGRVREHWQLNVDVLGGEPLLADIEVLSFGLSLMKEFGGDKFVKIKINNRRLMDHFFIDTMKMKPETATAVTKALDARAKVGEETYAEMLKAAGVDSSSANQKLETFFKLSLKEMLQQHQSEGTKELESVFRILKDAGFEKQIEFDPMVLRGMDYYTGTVFEMYDVSPENNRAMFGGGRYDNLLSLFGKFSLSGVGLGMGDVTLRNFLEVHKLLPVFKSEIDIFVTLPKMELLNESEEIARVLRSAGLRVVTPLSTDGFGAQLKQASKMGAHYAVLLGEDELSKGKVAVKNLETGKQFDCDKNEIAQTIKKEMASHAK
jgi:histidyl-tRNA synthetase